MADNQGTPGTVQTDSRVTSAFLFFNHDAQQPRVAMWQGTSSAERLIKAVWRNETGAGDYTRPDARP